MQNISPHILQWCRRRNILKRVEHDKHAVTSLSGRQRLGSTMLPRRVAYIDGEDPNLSSWCRYLNHCKRGERGCNCEPKSDAGLQGLVWFVARREIKAGEELCFDYGSSYRWDYP